MLNYHKNGGYSSWDIYNKDIRLQRVSNDLINGKYVGIEIDLESIYENLLTYNDEFFVLKDFNSYLKAQEKVD